MKKVISFSIYGNKPMYTIGILKNLELSSVIYPGWDVYIYYNNTVPQEFIEKYKNFDNVTLFDMTGFSGPGVLWRFLPKDNVERFISRDGDSRLSMREKYAVDEWIESRKSLHIIRDHPNHGVPIYAVLFGLVVTPELNMKKDILNWNSMYYFDLYYKYADTPFLNEYVYNKYIKYGDIICHNSCDWSEFPYSKPFPTKMENYHFVGEIFDEYDNRKEQYMNWIDKKEFGY